MTLSLTELLKEKTVAELANEMGVHPSTIYRKMKKQGISECKSNRFQDKYNHLFETKESALELLKNYNRSEIAIMCETTVSTITKKLLSLGISKHHTIDRNGPEQLKNKEWLSDQISQKSLHEIAEELDTSTTRVQTACKKLNIDILNKKHISDSRYHDKKWLEEHVLQMSCNEIADILCTTGSSISKQCQKFGIYVPDLTNLSEKTMQYLTNRELMLDDYINKKMSIGEIASMIGSSSPPVSKYLKKHGIEIRKDHIHNLLSDRNWLQQQIDDYIFPIEIAKILEVSVTTIYKWMKIYDIKENDIKFQERTPLESRKLLANKEWLTKAYKQYTIEEISNMLNVSVTPIQNSLRYHEIETNIHRIQSAGERDIISKFPEHHIISNTRDLTDSQVELDIYFPDVKFGVEYDGMYWHSSTYKEKMYHQNKKILFKSKGIDILQIWDYEWNDPLKQDIIESMIRNRIEKPKYIMRASQCKILKLSVSQTREFLNENHIQGYTNAKIKYGLEYNNQIIACMTFGSPRFSKKTDLELIRFAVKKNHRIHGGASKLFKFFRSNYEGSVISYCDLRYGTGKMYESIGFDYIGMSKPNYQWHNKYTGEILPRYRTQKHLLKNILGEMFDHTLSERENMERCGWVQIFDSGNLVYEYH